MQQTQTGAPLSTRKTIWINIIFFAIMGIGGLIGAPLYFYHHGLSLGLFALSVFYLIATGLAITVGYHRHFSHQSFQTHKFIQFLLLFFGAAAFEQTAYRWSAQHRDHHRFVDTDSDPYSIKKGFWYAHMGWLMFWEHESSLGNVKDLEKNKLVMHQDKHYLLWSMGAGVVLPLLIGVLMGETLGAFLFTVCLRITLVYQSTFFINSVCHIFGKATYDIYSTAKDNWFVAFLTYGEGYHNFHHRFPSDYRNAVRWYQWDPSKWTIAFLEKIGMASRLCRVSDFAILNARISGENQRIQDQMANHNATSSQLEQALELLKKQYALIRNRLSTLEVATREYRTLMAERVSHTSDELILAAKEKVQEAKEQFSQTYACWKSIRQVKPTDLKKMLVCFGA